MRKSFPVVLAFALAACATQRPVAVAPRPSGMSERVRMGDKLVASLDAKATLVEHLSAPRTTYVFECVGDCGGTGGWREVTKNTVLNGGRNDLLDKYFKGSAYSATWYLALKGTGSIAAADVWTSHAGWSEVTPYSGNRPTITWGTTSSQSNTATQVSISINATATVAGACLSSVNTGTSGILYACTDFAASRSVVSGDTLNVTPTVTD